MTFTCPTGTNNFPVGYNCTLNPNPLSVTGTATSTMMLSPVTAMAEAVHTAEFGPRNVHWKMELVAGILLLSLMLTGVGGSKGGKGILFAAGCVLCVCSIVTGCGAGGGGGPVPSTTMLTTSNNRVTFQTPLTYHRESERKRKSRRNGAAL